MRPSTLASRNPPVRGPLSGTRRTRSGAATAPAREEADLPVSSLAYARRFEGDAGAWFLERQTEIVREYLAHLSPGCRLLDVGGGHAQIASLARGEGHPVVVVGSRPDCPAPLAPLLECERVEYRCADLVRLPWKRRTFEAAVSIRMLAHVRDWRVFLAELCRVADRSVIVDYASARSLNALPVPGAWIKQRLETAARSYRLIRPRELTAELRANGFEPVARDPQFLLPMVLHRAADRVELSRRLERAFETVGLTAIAGSPVLVRADRIE